jgi:hypothetical protein
MIFVETHGRASLNGKIRVEILRIERCHKWQSGSSSSKKRIVMKIEESLEK